VLIALAAALLFVVAHFTVLAPKDDAGPTPVAKAPGQQGLENAIGKAKNAVAQSQASATRSQKAAANASGDTQAGAPTKPATPSKAKATAAPKAKPTPPLPKLDPGDRSGPILQDLAAGKVVVALFYNPQGSDDNAALRAVRQANRRHGRVVLHSIPIQDVGDYNALTTGVEVLQAPTVLVIGPDHKARTIVGYTEVKEIDQTVFDAGGFGKKHKPARR
jgi:hypothetical protein